MVDRSAIDEALDAYMATFTAGDRAGWLASFAEGAWIEDPVGTPRHEGVEAIGRFWDGHHEVVEHIELRPLGLRTVVGNEAAHTMQARTLLGDTTYIVDIISVLTFDDDARVTTMRAFFDPSTIRPEG
jgi:steroid delta-isomerase